MTMVAAIHCRTGGPVLAADCCASIRFDGDPRTVHRDELQKVYALAPYLAIAYSTDDVQAVHRLLRAIPSVEGEVVSALALSPAAPQALAAVLADLAETEAPDATVLLGVIGVPEGEPPYLFTWDSRAPYRATVVPAGCGVILGSGSTLPDLVAAAEACADTRQATALQASALFADRYFDLYHQQHERWTASGVGGLLHSCCVGADRRIKYADTPRAAKYADACQEYEIAMRYDEAEDKWRQRRTDGRQIDVVNGLNLWFQPVNADMLLLE